jgi:hypothetical protein
MFAAATTHGIFSSDTVGLVFTWLILLPGIATGLVIVAIVSARGDKMADEQVRGRWGRKRSTPDA